VSRRREGVTVARVEVSIERATAVRARQRCLYPTESNWTRPFGTADIFEIDIDPIRAGGARFRTGWHRRRRCRRWTNPLSRGYITDGLENAPAALLQGHNFGEALVRIVPPA
jgi:hypothetical protein